MNEPKSEHTKTSKILIVDDQIHIHKLLSKFLEKNGYQIESCYDSSKVITVNSSRIWF